MFKSPCSYLQEIYKMSSLECLVLEDGKTQAINLSKYVKYSKIHVETGTCNGCGVQRALNAGFEIVKSVELSPEWYEKSKKRFAGNSRVQLFLGDSRTHLQSMLGNSLCVVLLDAHPAGPGTAGHDDTSGNFCQDKILEDEVKILVQSGKRHIVIIDDQTEINPYLTPLFENYSFEFVCGKYMVCMPTELL